MKEKNEWTTERVRRWMRAIKLILISALILGLILLVFSCATNGIWFWTTTVGTIGLTVLSVSLGFFFAGLTIIQRPYNLIIEVFGQYYTTLEAGLHWICPLFMKVRAAIPGWTRPIPIFEEKPSIDFKDGGTAVLVDPTFWCRITGPEKAIYEVSNWQAAARELIETYFRSYLGSITVEETIVKIYEKRSSWWTLLDERYPIIRETLSPWGIECQSITVTDFDWGDEVVHKLQEVFKERRNIVVSKLKTRAAKYDAKKEALLIGGIVLEIKKILVQKNGYPPDEAGKLAPSVYQFVKAADTRSLFLTSPQTLESAVATAIAVIDKTREKIKPA